MSDTPKKTPKLRPRWKVILLGIIRWTWIPVACVLALFAGLALGYVYIGKQSLSDVFQAATWRHVYDLIFSDT
ncbi:DNA-directed RNA polymerase subunit beta [Paenibacillus filicis]|uniref:DNA-directed RNA polymerase subunit beta n=1 Tax=Paenibacillus gyeongsangnamensis TaxID=3388067 RepID=A0ABT4QD92_9BACL|nr:DNA-directed RNA polymerase subunit beta [Paenibacillus filicis]MCZ8514849.1 DNA-directed RNA polymerase subunit beta [Paenibacillus filicis]